MKNILKKYYLVFILLIVNILFKFFIIFFLPIADLLKENLLFSELINRPYSLPSAIISIIGLLNIILINVIFSKNFGSKVGIFGSLLYAFSPWTIYLELASSMYIFILFLLLILLLVTATDLLGAKLRVSSLVLTSIILLYSSIFSWIIIPVLMFSLYKLKILEIALVKRYLLILSILCTPLIFILLKNPIGIKNIFTNNVSVFSNIGLLNTINRFQGETRESSLQPIARIIENKYAYFSKHLLFQLLKQFTPAAYFTNQEKLLNFSLTPPIFIGFLVPFLFGIQAIARYLYNKWIIAAIGILFVPSILSGITPDLNRLIIVSPLIFLVISFGVCNMNSSKKKVALLTIAVLLVTVQLLVTVSDVVLREQIRYERAIAPS